jgi:hypothetical protein
LAVDSETNLALGLFPRRPQPELDQAAEASDEENEVAFRELDRASQHLMRAEALTLAGLIAQRATGPLDFA